MRIFNVTDLHGRLDHLESVSAAMAESDLVVVAGDITNFGGRAEAEAILDALAEINPKILAIAGNCDRRSVDACLSERGINLHAGGREEGGLWIAGLGGSLPGPAPTPSTFSEEELGELLGRLRDERPRREPPRDEQSWSGRAFVLVSHQPPLDTVADRIASGRHVGSRSVRDFIEAERPILCLTGHIHESVGQQSVAGCRLVNPGPFGEGRYAVIEIDASGGVEVELHGG